MIWAARRLHISQLHLTSSKYVKRQAVTDDGVEKDADANNILVLMFGVQLVIQISTFLTLFLMMCDTYVCERASLASELFEHPQGQPLAYSIARLS